VIPLVRPGIGDQQLATLHGVEYIGFDFDRPRFRSVAGPILSGSARWP
jgi:hypothetical protein